MQGPVGYMGNAGDTGYAGATGATGEGIQVVKRRSARAAGCPGTLLSTKIVDIIPKISPVT